MTSETQQTNGHNGRIESSFSWRTKYAPYGGVAPDILVPLQDLAPISLDTLVLPQVLPRRKGSLQERNAEDPKILEIINAEKFDSKKYREARKRGRIEGVGMPYDPYYDDPEMDWSIEDKLMSQAELGEAIHNLHEVLPLAKLIEKKQEQGVKVHVIIPTLNEGTKANGESNVGKTLDNLKPLKDVGLVDQFVVYDSDSVDDTKDEVTKRSVKFVKTSDKLKELGYEGVKGKGANLWAATVDHSDQNDILIFCDADFGAVPSKIQAIASPLIENPDTQLSLSIFKRLTKQGNTAAAAVPGGRVTQIMWKPVADAWFPEAGGLVEPIAGLYAGRGSALAQSPFPTDYRIETRLVIDTMKRYKPDAVSQIFAGVKSQDGQSTSNLRKMSTQIFHEFQRLNEEWNGFSSRSFHPDKIAMRSHTVTTNGHTELGANEFQIHFVDLPAPVTLK